MPSGAGFLPGEGGSHLPAANIHAARQLNRESRHILTASSMRRIIRALCIVSPLNLKIEF
jgi:hypothetical protein